MYLINESRNKILQCIRKLSVMETKNDVIDVFRHSIQSVNTQKLIRDNVRIENDQMIVRSKHYNIKKGVHVVGFGKAVVGMAIELEKILGCYLQSGIVSVPEGIFTTFQNQPNFLPKKDTKLCFFQGAKNNYPDKNAENASRKIINLIKTINKDSLLIVLISGGGSALFTLPKHPITLDEKLNLIKLLSLKGAEILELNCVRKQLSCVKGGGLAKLAYPVRLVSFILSDIIGDPIDFIASGPTSVNLDNPNSAIKIIEKYSLQNELSQSIKLHLYEHKTDINSPLNKNCFCHVDNFLLGNNRNALNAAYTFAQKLNYYPFILSSEIQGNVVNVAQMYADIVHFIENKMNNHDYDLNQVQSLINTIPKIDSNMFFNMVFKNELKNVKGICLIAGGEPTVFVKGQGLGGRNQELVLQFMHYYSLLEKKGNTSVTFLSAGTDGIDGPTDAAGAIYISGQETIANEQGLIIEDFINDNNSYGFYSALQNGDFLVHTGHTGTNVMDIHILIIKYNSNIIYNRTKL